jgi:hypothetical protein
MTIDMLMAIIFALLLTGTVWLSFNVVQDDLYEDEREDDKSKFDQPPVSRIKDRT